MCIEYLYNQQGEFKTNKNSWTFRENICKYGNKTRESYKGTLETYTGEDDMMSNGPLWAAAGIR